MQTQHTQAEKNVEYVGEEEEGTERREQQEKKRDFDLQVFGRVLRQCQHQHRRHR